MNSAFLMPKTNYFHECKCQQYEKPVAEWNKQT